LASSQNRIKQDEAQSAPFFVNSSRNWDRDVGPKQLHEKASFEPSEDLPGTESGAKRHWFAGVPFLVTIAGLAVFINLVGVIATVIGVVAILVLLVCWGNWVIDNCDIF
jgi:hypothetical protein